MTTMIKKINESIDDKIKNYRALRNSAFNLSWDKCFLVQQEKQEVWKKIEFLKKLKKACINKK